MKELVEVIAKALVETIRTALQFLRDRTAELRSLKYVLLTVIWEK